jgi:hypothetical protein
MKERRSQRRITDAELVMISCDMNGGRLRQLGNLEDLSPNGAGIIVQHAITVNSPVTITYGNGDLNAVVRHCAPLPEGHFVGIEFVGASRSSTLHFQPELLVRPL